MEDTGTVALKLSFIKLRTLEPFCAFCLLIKKRGFNNLHSVDGIFMLSLILCCLLNYLKLLSRSVLSLFSDVCVLMDRLTTAKWMSPDGEVEQKGQTL